MVYVRRTAIRAPVYQGDGLLSWARKAAKKVSKAVKSPVGKVAQKIYNRTVAPIAKQALVGAVGEKLANSIENVGKRTLAGEDIDSALVGEAKSAAAQAVGMGVRGPRYARTSDLLKRPATTIKVVRPRPSAVMNRIQQEGGSLEEETVM